MQVKFDLSKPSGMRALLTFIKDRHIGSQPATFDLIISSWIHAASDFKQLQQSVRSKARSYKTLVKPALVFLQSHFDIEYQVQLNKTDNVVTLTFEEDTEPAINALNKSERDEVGTNADKDVNGNPNGQPSVENSAAANDAPNQDTQQDSDEANTSTMEVMNNFPTPPTMDEIVAQVQDETKSDGIKSAPVPTDADTNAPKPINADNTAPKPIKPAGPTMGTPSHGESRKTDAGVTRIGEVSTNEKFSHDTSTNQAPMAGDTTYAQVVSHTVGKSQVQKDMGTVANSKQPVLKQTKLVDAATDSTPTPKPHWYYGVRKGVEPGIYTDWQACEKMVIGFKGAVYKKFNTRAAAEAFVAQAEPQDKPTSEVIDKYYAVRCGRSTGIYIDWAEVEQLTNGYSGAEFKSFPSLEEATEYLAQKSGNDFTHVTAGHRHSSPSKTSAVTDAKKFATPNPFDALDQGSKVDTKEQQTGSVQGIMQAAISNVQQKPKAHFNNSGTAVRVKPDGSVKPDNYMAPAEMKPSIRDQIASGSVAVIHAKRGEELDTTQLPTDVSILRVHEDGGVSLSMSQNREEELDMGPIQRNTDHEENGDEPLYIKTLVPAYKPPPQPHYRYQPYGYQTMEKMIEHDFLDLCHQGDAIWYVSQATTWMKKQQASIVAQKASILGSMAQKERDAMGQIKHAVENETMTALGKVGAKFHEMELQQTAALNRAHEANQQLLTSITQVQEAHRVTNDALKDHHVATRDYKDVIQNLSNGAVNTTSTVNALQAKMQLQEQQLSFYKDQWTASKERLDRLEQVVEGMSTVTPTPVPDPAPSGGPSHAKQRVPDRPISSDTPESVDDDDDSDDDEVVLVPPPHQCQTYVLIRKGDGTNERVWLLNWRVHRGRNFYYGKDANDDRHIFYQDDILGVLALPRVKEHLGTFGYPPGRATQFPGEDAWRETITVDPPGTPRGNRPSSAPVTPRYEVPQSTLFPDAARIFAMETERQYDQDAGLEDQEPRPYQSSYSRYRTYTENDLDSYQYVYPKGSATYYTTIKESYIMEKSSTLFTRSITDEHDVPAFYNDLKDKLSVYGIRMKDYTILDPDESIFVISEANCVNYKAAHTTMSRCLYRVLDEHKDSFFPNHTKLCDLSEVYEEDKDGEAYLMAVIRMEHKNFKHLTKQSKGILQELVIPPFTSDKRLLPWLNELKKYAKDKEIPPYKIFTYVRLQLREDTRFDKALVEMDRISDEYAGGTGYMPKQFHIGELGTYILDQYNEAESNILSQSKKAKPYGIKHLSSKASAQGSITITHLSNAQDSELDTIQTMLQEDQYYVPAVYEDYLCESLEASGATINRMATRSQRRQHEQQRDRRSDIKSPARAMKKAVSYASNQKQRTSMKPPTDQRCPACSGPHKLEECKRIGPFIAMSEWIRRQPPARQREVLKAYLENLKEAHKRYEMRYAKRMGIHNTINLCDMQGDTRDQFIQACREEDHDLDFGNADFTYSGDEPEPYLNFDPTSLAHIAALQQIQDDLNQE